MLEHAVRWARDNPDMLASTFNAHERISWRDFGAPWNRYNRA
jgi:hypothetical protein